MQRSVSENALCESALNTVVNRWESLFGNICRLDNLSITTTTRAQLQNTYKDRSTNFSRILRGCWVPWLLQSCFLLLFSGRMSHAHEQGHSNFYNVHMRPTNTRFSLPSALSDHSHRSALYGCPQEPYAFACASEDIDQSTHPQADPCPCWKHM